MRRVSRRLIRSASWAVLTVAMMAAPGPPDARAQGFDELLRGARTAQPGLFGSLEFASGTLVALPQWTRVLDAMREDAAHLASCVASEGSCRSPAARSWRDILLSAPTGDRAQLLRHVNAAFNKWPYKLDLDNYGMSDYWASPPEFLARSGDCEDYAVIKFFALRQLGIPNDEMRIVALFDRIRGIGHAVLVVRSGEDHLVLDNLTDLIFSHARYRHYDPQYSVNETTRWAHLKRAGASPGGKP